jgi:hypothetical protein
MSPKSSSFRTLGFLPLFLGCVKSIALSYLLAAGFLNLSVLFLVLSSSESIYCIKRSAFS